MKPSIKLKWAVLLGALAFVAGCKQIGQVLFPDLISQDENWELRETAHFRMFYRPNSAAARDIEKIIAIMEDAYLTVVRALEVKYNNRIINYIYSSLDDKVQHTGYGGTAVFAIPPMETIVCVYTGFQNWGVGPHEIVHVVVYWTVGLNASNMLTEGIAVAITGSYGGRPPHVGASQYARAGQLKSLETMFDNAAWGKAFNVNSDLCYIQAGSFVAYLVERFGIREFKSFYPRASPNTYRQSFQDIYGLALDDVYRQWLAFLADF